METPAEITDNKLKQVVEYLNSMSRGAFGSDFWLAEDTIADLIEEWRLSGTVSEIAGEIWSEELSAAQ